MSDQRDSGPKELASIDLVEYLSLVTERDALRKALREIIAINEEDPGTFRKRGGTRRGLSIVAASAALALDGDAK